MRITEELKNRINRQLHAKYDGESRTAEKVYEDRIEAEKDAAVAELESIISTRTGRFLFNSRSYSETSAASYIMNNKSTFFPEAYEEYRDTSRAVTNKIKNDYEELAIQVAYQKDIDGIKEIFKTMGLTF